MRNTVFILLLLTYSDLSKSCDGVYHYPYCYRNFPIRIRRSLHEWLHCHFSAKQCFYRVNEECSCLYSAGARVADETLVFSPLFAALVNGSVMFHKTFVFLATFANLKEFPVLRQFPMAPK